MTAPVRGNDGTRGPGGTGANALLRLKDRSQELLAGFSSGQKAVVGVALLAVVLGGYFFMSWAGKPSYVPLFSNLSSSDAAAITQKLASDKVPYQLGESGEQILVPQGDVYQQRLDMASAGLPSSGDQGYSLLDSSGVTTSQFQQQVEYQQAVSDELEKTIESMNGVSSSLVSVVIPQESLFATSTQQPSASVLVSLLPGTALSAEQVQAVVHLVASSIEGLSPQNVTVVDQNGDVLNAPGSDSSNVAAGSMEQQQTDAYEQSLDTSLQDMLSTIVGPGNAVVQANAALDFNQTQTNSQIYNPNHQAAMPVQQASSQETYIGPAASAAAQGVVNSANASAGSTSSGVTTTLAASGGATQPAVSTNKTATVSAGAANAGTKTPVVTTPSAKIVNAGNASAGTKTGGAKTGGAGGASSTTVPSYTQVGMSQENVVSEVTKTESSAPGALERLSVAVVVNSSVKGVSPAEIKQLVSAAAGLQPSRGDTIHVAMVPFDQSAAKQAAAQLKAETSASKKSALMGEARDGAVVLAVIGLLLFAMRRITKTTRVPLALPIGYQHLELEAGEGLDEDEEMTMALPSAEPQLMMGGTPVQAEVAQIGQMIEREPERIAEMLRAWLETGPNDR